MNKSVLKTVAAFSLAVFCAKDIQAMAPAPDTSSGKGKIEAIQSTRAGMLRSLKGRIEKSELPVFNEGKWVESMEDKLNLIIPVSKEMISTPEAPSVFAIGDELIVEKAISVSAKTQLIKLMTKYGVSGIEKVQKIPEAAFLSPESCRFLKDRLLQIVALQKKVVIEDIKLREKLKAQIDKMIKGSGMSAAETEYYQEWSDSLRQEIEDDKDLLKVIGEFEQDLNK